MVIPFPGHNRWFPQIFRHAYPARVARKRKRHQGIVGSKSQDININPRTLMPPG